MENYGEFLKQLNQKFSFESLSTKNQLNAPMASKIILNRKKSEIT